MLKTIFKLAIFLCKQRVIFSSCLSLQLSFPQAIFLCSCHFSSYLSLQVSFLSLKWSIFLTVFLCSCHPSCIFGFSAAYVCMDVFFLFSSPQQLPAESQPGWKADPCLRSQGRAGQEYGKHCYYVLLTYPAHINEDRVEKSLNTCPSNVWQRTKTGGWRIFPLSRNMASVTRYPVRTFYQSL